ncbi:MAG: hypothetical protein HWE34_02050 [Methylocystaceae bacterium]|nr:hypothetical protein [Methylocystaceae bacterium]
MRKNTSQIGKSFETAVNNFFIKHPGIQIEELENLVSPSFAIDGIGAATGLNGWKNGLIAYEIKYVKNFNALERSIHNIFSKLPVGTELDNRLRYILLVTNYVFTEEDKERSARLKNEILAKVQSLGGSVKNIHFMGGDELIKEAKKVIGSENEIERFVNLPKRKGWWSRNYNRIPLDNSLSVILTNDQRSWEDSADAFVLPASQNLDLQGIISDHIRRASTMDAWKRFEHLVQNSVPVNFGIETPFKVPAPPDLSIQSQNIIIATAYGKSKINTKAAVAAVVKLIENYNYQTIILPIIGGQSAGSEKALMDLLEALLEYRGSSNATFIIPLPEPSLHNKALDKIADKTVSENLTPALQPDAFSAANDGIKSKDSLNVTNQARVFSKLLISDTAKMPLAIGLFGKWGSGKSFFMRKIRKSAIELETAQKDNPDSPYVQGVVHIEFNAWHYVDADLWASLVNHIYTEIAKYTEQEETPAVKAENAANNAKKQAQKRHKDANAKIEEIKTRIKELNGEREKEQKEALKDSAVSDVKSVLSRLGYANETVTSIDDINKIHSELTEISSSVVTLLPSCLRSRWIGQSFFGKAILTIVLCCLFGGFTYYLPAILGYFDLKSIEAKTTTWLTSASAIALIIREKLKQVQNGIFATEKLKNFLSNNSISNEAINQLNIQIKAQEEALAQSEQDVIDAQADRIRAENGGPLIDFIMERKNDPNYLDSLGIVSLIRRDFEDLQGQLETWSSKPTNRPIKRIVLYIDDLDRCEPDRVVEVLQAVHLLLAFELFAVIVAVDPRWLERALYKRYAPDWFKLDDEAQKKCEFEPHNYLEKIFQIPYHTSDMSVEGYEQLISDLAEKHIQVASNDFNESNTPAKTENEAAKNEQEKSIDDVLPIEEERPIENLSPIYEDSQEPFNLREYEVAFLKSLYPLVQTPRLTKRLMNLYILLRVQITSEGIFELPKALDREKGEYRAIALMLGLVVSRPHALTQLKQFIEKHPLEDIHAIISHISEDKNGKDQAFEVNSNFLIELEDKHGEFPSIFVFQNWLPKIQKFSFDWK